MREITFIERSTEHQWRASRAEFSITQKDIENVEFALGVLEAKFKDNKKNLQLALNLGAGPVGKELLVMLDIRFATGSLINYTIQDYHNMHNKQDITQFIEYFQKDVLDRQKWIIGQFKRKITPPKADYIAEIIPDMVKNNYGVGHKEFKVYTAKLRTGIVCSECDSIVTKSSYQTHVASFNCLKDHLSREVYNRGWTPIETSQDVQAVRRSRVQYDIIPANFNVWAPKWVGDAIEAYHKNKDGYAGMTLTEYLDKVNEQNS